jgi:hypothetical protein
MDTHQRGQSHQCASGLAQVFSNTAAALPAELGPDGQLVEPKEEWYHAPSPSRAMRAWRKRMACQRRRREVCVPPPLPDTQAPLCLGFRCVCPPSLGHHCEARRARRTEANLVRASGSVDQTMTTLCAVEQERK